MIPKRGRTGMRKCALCCKNGHTVEDSGEVIEDHLAAYENYGGYMVDSSQL